ncbi:autotransporter assembly complex protein TamA [Rivibacter subsaxonicus]|uniref:autotransporter assembly complex protein TamA n=1 Tax=Rivibacter subsaxonicus TaxID=457575 RepID=UPI00102B09E0|nr:BamA/TamA family outer membrane protein [Rivibacter subsaxonicus]
MASVAQLRRAGRRRWWAPALLLALAAAQPLAAQTRDAGLDSLAAEARDEERHEQDERANLFDSGSSTIEGKTYRLVIVTPSPLRELLERHLDLARFASEDDVSDTELGRLMAAAPAQVQSLLEPEGFFEPEVEIGRSDAAAASGGTLPTVTLRVRPGVQARISRLQLELQGPLLDSVNAGDERAQNRWRRAQRRWSLDEGELFTQRAWSRSKTALLADLRSYGYPTASFLGTSAHVDAAQASVRLFVATDSGPLFRVGSVRIEGLQRTPESAALNVRPFDLGTIFSEQMLIDYQEALSKVGLYDGIAVELDTSEPEQADDAVVIARLRERKFQEATFSVGYSTDTGPRFGIEYTHRRLFDTDWIFSARANIGSLERSLSVDLLSYPKQGGWRHLVGASADYLDAGGSITQTRRLRVGRSLDSLRFTRLVFAEFNETALETTTQRGIDRAIWANYQWTRRDVNNLVFPTRGTIWTLQGGGGYARDSDQQQGPFGRVQGRLVWYMPLGGGWLLQARGEGATILTRDEVELPDSLKFRAGGDDSVRGYAYQSLGPQRDGSTVGGNVMATGSVEVMHRLSERWRDWYGAVFVDAGNAADSWDGFDAALGYGVGIRWRSPIGPLRMDVAYGQQVKQARLHFSVGLSF